MIHLLQAAGRARASHSRVRGAHPRRAAQPRLRLRAVRDAHPARRSAARARRSSPSSSSARRATRTCWSRLADFYERVEEKDSVDQVLTAARRRSRRGDPSHLVDLGDRYFQQGDKKKALETWARIKTVVPNRAKALATLGEVYLDHDMPTEGARGAARRRCSSSRRTSRYKKALRGRARAHREPRRSLVARRPQRYDEARGDLGGAARAAPERQDPRARGAHAHRHAVGLLHQLEQQVAPLAAAASPQRRPTSRRAGCSPRCSAAAQAARRRATLRRVVRARAGRRRVVPRARARARAAAEPARRDRGAREARRDRPEARARVLPAHGAVRGRALPRRRRHRVRRARGELSPDDAEGPPQARRDVPQEAGHRARHRRVPRSDRQERQALPGLLRARRAPAFARRRPTRPTACSGAWCARAPDEELVSQAARQSMQINLGKGTLESLEQDLLPVAIGNPRKTIYRRLLGRALRRHDLPARSRRCATGNAARRRRRDEDARRDRHARGQAAARRARRRARSRSSASRSICWPSWRTRARAPRSSPSPPGRPSSRCACRP